MTLDSEDIQAIAKQIAVELREAFGLPSPTPPPLDSLHQVQQQALQLVREGKRAESIELVKSYSRRESIARKESQRRAA